MELKQPYIAVDCVVFDKQERLLLIKRKFSPYEGQYALPGGFVEVGETTEQAALRELVEETNVKAQQPRLVGVYSEPARDPRRHVISVAYLVPFVEAVPQAGDDAASASFVANWQDIPLAFDHRKIVEDAWRLYKGY